MFVKKRQNNLKINLWCHIKKMNARKIFQENYVFNPKSAIIIAYFTLMEENQKELLFTQKKGVTSVFPILLRKKDPR